MAEPLIHHYGPEIPRAIARMIAAVHPEFRDEAFVRDALRDYEALALMQRGHKIAAALHAFLPRDYPQALEILLASIERPTGLPETNTLASFLFLPHTLFVARHGLDHFTPSMHAQHALTQRFSAEFSIRRFIEADPTRTLKQLRIWAGDPSEHVRRLVSEGTRPRLPWAQRLTAFVRDPRPVLELLELLKDDPSLYVRRSVANNLNDIGKDHPQILVETAAHWSRGASEERSWIVRHALRSAVKRGDAGALRVLGFDAAAKASVENARLSPSRVEKGASVDIGFDVVNPTRGAQRLVIDFAVHYVKANGRTHRKVFKLRALTLAGKARVALSKRLSLEERTTRRHHPGSHRVEALINGRAIPLGAFDLRD